MNVKIKAAALILSAASIFSLCSFTSNAAGEDIKAEEAEIKKERSGIFERYELSVSKVYNKNINAYNSASLSYNGRAVTADVRMINGVPNVDVEALLKAITGMRVTYNAKSKTLNARGSGFDMDVIDGSNVIYANGRTLFSMTPSALMSNGKIYAPLNNIAKAIGLKYSLTTRTSVRLDGAVSPITHGSVYYASDAVYWLSRIISAESRGEPLLGQIAVGSVVMNRVASKSYPNTIWGVIFDRKYGVQFSPINDGSIYKAPVASAVVAAKICLEGFNVNRSALFFLYPIASSSSWIPNNREYLFSIGRHDFYA